MNLAIFWLPIIGGILLGSVAVAAWYNGDRIQSLWFGLAGVICFLLVLALQARQATLQSSEESEHPFVFVTGMWILPSIFSANGIGRIEGDGIWLPTLIGQPGVNIEIRVTDQPALDVDAACGFIITENLPLQRPPTNQPDITVPGVPWPSQFDGVLRCICPFTISKTQEQLLALKREIFVVYGWIKYRGNRPHETGFAGIWNVSKYSFSFPKNPTYNYQK